WAVRTTAAAVRSAPPPVTIASTAPGGGVRQRSIRAGTRGPHYLRSGHIADISRKWRERSRLRSTEHRHALPPALRDLAHDDLDRRGDGHREDRADDAEQRTAEEDDGERGEARQLDGRLHHRGLEHGVLDRLVDEE